MRERAAQARESVAAQGAADAKETEEDSDSDIDEDIAAEVQSCSLLLPEQVCC